MGDLINLRLVRKARSRDAKNEAAALNRRSFGRSKAERQASTLHQAKAERQLDGAKRASETGDDTGVA